MSGRTQLTLFLCGDVMTGRGIDQILPRSCPPRLYEPVVRSAREYVALAERVNGPIPRPVDHAYVWGEALDALDREGPEVRIINLETSLTTSEDAEPKDINYRMHPGNIPVLTAAHIDCCGLANNHVLDWGPAGLIETLDTLARAGIRAAGAGTDLETARQPAILPLAGGARVLLFAFGSTDSGISRDWAAGVGKPGVHLLPDFSDRTVDGVGRLVGSAKRPGDIALASVHWGSNWGYEIPEEHRRFAHGLIDRASIDVVQGHSSHHPKAIEVHHGRPILYGCGDLLNDYEGIGGYEAFRDDLVLLYFPTLDRRTGLLTRLRMVPLQIRRLRLGQPTPQDRAWLAGTMDRECRRFSHQIREGDHFLELRWG